MSTQTFETFKLPDTDTAEALRRFDDAATWASEVLHGSMRTSFEFYFDNNELYGHDGLPLTAVFDNAVIDAERTVAEDPFLLFQLRRCRIERGELDDMLSMSRREAPNTMVVVSDFPVELESAKKDVGGYNVTRKQTMMRIISRRSDGVIETVSQSLEGSNRKALEAIYESLGREAQPGELLGQRIHLELDEYEQTLLTDKLTNVYDQELTNQHGGQWRAGWQLPANQVHVNTYDFVLRQKDLIYAFLDQSEKNPDALYGFAAAMENRYNREIANQGTSPIDSPGITDFLTNTPMREMLHAASEARLERKVYSGCGASVGGGGELSSEQQLGASGYGNKADEDKFGSLTFKCPKGHTNRRPRNKLIPNCQQCGVDVRC